MSFKRISYKHIVLLVVMLLVLSGCGEGEQTSQQNQTQGSQSQQNEQQSEQQKENNDQSEQNQAPKELVYSNEGLDLLDSSKHPEVTIEMSNGEIIKVELYPEIAPNTVSNFVSLVQEGYYDGLIFHRVIPGFMIQGGDPEGTGMGGPGYTIEGEFAANGIENPIVHTRGVISMARSMDHNSAGSQFFIMHEDAPHLDGQYAAFGEVTEGIEVVDEIVMQTRDSNDKPLEPLAMSKVTVDLRESEIPELVKQ